MNVKKLDETIEAIEDMIISKAKQQMIGQKVLADEISALASLIQARVLAETIKGDEYMFQQFQ